MDGKSKELLQKLDGIIDQHLSDGEFSVEELASKMGYSRSHLHRLLDRACGKSISQYLREYRLEKAMLLLQEKRMNVSETAFNMGFGSASYFSKVFSEYFGYPPREVEFKEDVHQELDTHGFLKKKLLAPRTLITLLIVAIVIPALIYFTNIVGESSEVEGRARLSVALLPFTNLSNLEHNQYFCDGVGDAVSRKLSSMANLRVVSRISTSHYAEMNIPFVTMARELNTAYVLNGSIQRYDNMVRVEVSLINGKTGTMVWSDNFDSELSNIFEIENEIADKVAGSISSTLIPSAASERNKGYTSNPEAYEFYLKGLYELRTYTSEGAKKSEEYFRNAVDLDTNFAMAYNWLGHSYIAQAAMFGMELTALEGLKKASVYIEKSIELAPDIKETRPMRAFYFLYHDWDFQRAEEEYLIGLGNTQSESYALYADYLNFVRRHDEALEMSRKQELNEPYFPNPRIVLSLFYSGRIDEAIAYAENRLRIQRNYWFLDCYGFVLLNSGRYHEALEVFKEIFQIENKKYPRIMGWMGAAYAHLGEMEKASEIISELKVMKAEKSVSSPGFFIAVVYSALGEQESALYWLRIAIEDHEMEIPWLISEPQFFELHDRPEFKKMVKEVGFPQYAQL